MERMPFKPATHLLEVDASTTNKHAAHSSSTITCGINSENLLQGYIPPSSDRRNGVLARKRKEYQIWVKQHYEMDDADRSDEELAILHQIKIDLPRTAAQVDLFRKSEIQS